MIRSMTGFGRKTAKSKYGTVTVEMRALNHKFFELSAKVPNGLGQFEDILKDIVHEKIKRGKVYLNLEVGDKKGNCAHVFIDVEMAKHYSRELTKLTKALKIKGAVRLDQLIELPGVIVAENQKLDAKKHMPHIKETLRKALNELVKDKEGEGKALYRDLYKRINSINKMTSHIGERSNKSIIKYKNHLTSKIRELTGAKYVDKGRLEQEVALFAKNCDVSEELTRLKSHVASFKSTLLAGNDVGKKLDFIAQELHREANTIASKSSDFKISKGVIQIKSDIEKIREQVKNVE